MALITKHAFGFLGAIVLALALLIFWQPFLFGFQSGWFDSAWLWVILILSLVFIISVAISFLKDDKTGKVLSVVLLSVFLVHFCIFSYFSYQFAKSQNQLIDTTKQNNLDKD